jgi:hypothetical protein
LRSDCAHRGRDSSSHQSDFGRALEHDDIRSGGALALSASSPDERACVRSGGARPCAPRRMDTARGPSFKARSARTSGRRIRCFNLSPSRSIESAPRQLRSRPSSFAPPISQARFAPDGQITQNLSSPFEKNISLPPSGKSALPARPSFPGKRGVSRSSRTRERMRWTRQRRRAQVIAGRVSRERYRRAGRTTPKRTAKPCGPGTRCWCQTAGGEIDPTGSKQPSSRQRR